MQRRTDAGRASLQVTAERVRRSIRRRLLFANVAGAVAVLTFLRLASGKSLAPEVPLWLQLLGPIAPAVLLILPGYLWGHRAFTRAIAWALEGRSPSLAERFAVLREPWRQALRPLLFWVIAAFVYAGITALFGASFITVARVIEGTLLGGVTTCALAYLLIERSFRPLFAHVLDRVPDRRPRTPGIRLRLLLTWAVGSGVPLLALALVLFLDGDEIPPYALAMLSLVGLAAGFIATVASARSLAEPLDGLRHALARVRDDDLDVGLVVDDGGEVGEVQAGFNRMVDGLRERRQIQDLFGRHVGQEVATQALEQGTGLRGAEADAERGVRRHRGLDRHGRGSAPRRRRRDAQRLLRRGGARRRRPGRVGQQVRGRRRPVRVRGAGHPARPRRPGAAGRPPPAPRPDRAHRAPSRPGRRDRRVVRTASSPATSAPRPATSTRCSVRR